MSGLRQMVETAIGSLKENFDLERTRAKTDTGLWARVASKLAAFTFAQLLNKTFQRPLLSFATLCSW